MKCKDAWLDAAEVFDAWRVVPRVLALGYFIWFPIVVFEILQWYFKLPATERTAVVTAFIGTVLATMSGLAGYVLKFYTDGGGGRDWTGRCAPAGDITQVNVSTK